MQGRSDGQRDVFDVESVAGHLLPAGSVFAFLAEHRMRLFPGDMFEDLFPSGRARPSIAPDVVASVIVLQTLHGLSDREAAEAVTFDLRWKAACGIAIDAGSFHPTTLTYWRRRLAASQRPHRIFEVVREVIVETGAVRGRQRRAMDSTVLDDAVARQDTVTQLIAAIRRVVRDVVLDGHGVAALVTEHCTRLPALAGQGYDSPGKPRIAWDDAAARDELVTALVGDALALLGALDLDTVQAAGGKPAEAVTLLALVAGQDVEPAEGSDGTDGRWRIARKVAPDRVISLVDPEARHAHKTREDRRDGYTAHIVNEPDTGLYTAVELTRAAGAENSDATVGTRLLTSDPTTVQDPTHDGGAPEPEQMQALGDSAYGTGQALADLSDAGWFPLIKPWPLRPAVEGGFTVDDFTHDPAAADGRGTLTCPAGHTRPLSPKRAVTFGKVCASCPLRERCTTSKTGKKTTVHEHDLLHREHRRRAADPDFQAIYRAHRPMVERSIAWLVRDNRRVPYRGVAKNNAWHHHRAAALNLRRLLALGLRHQAGAWQLG
jgi:IS5 family transposase